MNFTNLTILITGASRGLGRSTAIEFAKNGANIIINYNKSEEEAKILQEELNELYNVKTLAVKADITKEDEVKKMIEKSLEKFGNIDVLINNAAIAIDSVYEDKNKENFMKILETNVVGTFLVTKEVGKIMLENKSGNIINISSTNGIDTNYIESLDYDASKAAVNSMTKNFANYYAPYVRVNAVAPGWINTEMNKEMDIDFKKKEEDKILLNRFADPEEIAKVVVFLASDDAKYINGEIIRVDGGVKNV